MAAPETGNILYYISSARFDSAPSLTEDDLTGNFITIEGATYLELVNRGRKRHSIRTLNSVSGTDTVVLVK
jgi:hypothetical protein